MSVFYDGNGNQITIDGGSGASAFGVTDYKLYTDNDGSARQAVLTYDGKRLYPVNMQDQRQDKIKVYDGGVMLTLGDSFTAMMNVNYFDPFAAKHGLVQDNRGLVSSTIAGSADGTTVGYHAFWVRMDEAIAQYQADGGYTIGGTAYTAADVKLITFMGGANDWYTMTDGINRIGDIQSEDKEQLYGALKYIFPTLQTAFPNADIVVILQPFGNGYPMRLKEGIVREIAEMYGVPICDCAFEWYSQSNPTDLATYWQSDKLHLTAAGHQAVIDKLEKTVNNLPFTRN